MEFKGNLEGKWFHTSVADVIEFQGQILEVCSDDKNVKVQLYEWLDGCASKKIKIPITDIKFLYDTDIEMRNGYDKMSNEMKGLK